MPLPIAERRCYGRAMRFERILAGTVITTALGLAAFLLRPATAVAIPLLQPVPVSSTPLAFDRDDPARRRVGALTFLGAVQLRSTDALFGGISGLRAGDGAAMLAVTDTGNWLAFDTVERAGRLTGIENVLLTTIPPPVGKTMRTKADADAEALEFDPSTGIASIAFEQEHRVVHFAGIDPARRQSLAVAPQRVEHLTAMISWPANGGGEAMAVLPGGARVIISELALRPDGSHAALVTRSGVTREFGIAGIADHSPTDAIALDDRHLLVLHRRFDATGPAVALSLLDLAPVLGEMLPGAPLAAMPLAGWRPPATLDNMEGIAIRRSGARTFVYLVSDDNLNSLQRTLLMKFELVLPAPAPPA